MCGIVGLWYRATRGSRSRERTHLEQSCARMRDAIEYRGPDDAGLWSAPEQGLALGHRRLSIVDLSAAGAQPMHSSCGRMTVVYNGEIYNAGELRTALEGCGRQFRGHSDTEVMVEGFAEWGIEATLRRLIGMFAIAVWDAAERRLTLARDRLGIKPLYWLDTASAFAFASELKAFSHLEQWDRSIDYDAVASFFRHGYIPAPRTIYGAVRKLEPGRLIEIDGKRPVRERCYWSLAEVRAEAARAPSVATDDEVLDQAGALLGDAVARRMVADVPLGAFLSGGIDSSLVVALMQRHSSAPVKTFTIGFTEPAYDEAPHARAVAEVLGTEHTELYVSPDQAWEVIPDLASIYDEPFADSSQIPTFLVSRLTREHVTVSLSGDGGDELFAGYQRYAFAERLSGTFERLPLAGRRMARGTIRALGPAAWNALGRGLPGGAKLSRLGDRLHKLADVIADSPAGVYRQLVSQWDQPDALVPGASEPRNILWDEDLSTKIPDLVERLQFVDTLTYLPDDILTKVDRASMAVSLEARVPLLDHRIVEFAWGLPARMKRRGGTTKWLLRELLARDVPREVFEREKMGFGVPLGQWLRGPLRDWAESLLASPALRHDERLDPRLIDRRWGEHLRGEREWGYPLWSVLMLLAWKQRWC